MSKAQSNLSFYPLEDQFNSYNFNPAFLSSQKKSNFSVFPIGGTSIGYNNQNVINDLVSRTISGIAEDQDYINILKSMADHSLINQKIESTLLTYTLLSKVGFFNFQIREIELFSTAVKGDLSEFLFKTGIQSAIINQAQNLPAQAMHYREYSLGYSFAAKSNKFAAGIRAKIYFGKSAFFSGISGQIIPDALGGYTLVTGGKVNLSFPGENGAIKTASGKTLSYLMNSGNPGMGIDLGLNYRIMPELTLSMSVIDLGEIYWKKNLNSRNFNGFSPLPAGSVYPEAGSGIITKSWTSSLIDTISTKLEFTGDSSKFSRPMPATIYAGFKYQLNPSLKISLVDKYVILKNLSYNSFSLLASFDMNENLSVSTGYSIIGNSAKNIPLAFLIKKDFGQIYIGTDNLLAFIAPSFSDFAGFTFGTCFYLFRNKNNTKDPSDYFPSFKPRKTKKNARTGVIRKVNPEF
jgi:hypothetical protein